jgi:hypothetical protein
MANRQLKQVHAPMLAALDTINTQVDVWYREAYNTPGRPKTA